MERARSPFHKEATDKQVLQAGVLEQAPPLGEPMAADLGAGDVVPAGASGGRKERELPRGLGAVNWEDYPSGSWMEKKVSACPDLPDFCLAAPKNMLYTCENGICIVELHESVCLVMK